MQVIGQEPCRGVGVYALLRHMEWLAHRRPGQPRTPPALLFFAGKTDPEAVTRLLPQWHKLFVVHAFGGAEQAVQACHPPLCPVEPAQNERVS